MFGLYLFKQENWILWRTRKRTMIQRFCFQCFFKSRIWQYPSIAMSSMLTNIHEKEPKYKVRTIFILHPCSFTYSEHHTPQVEPVLTINCICGTINIIVKKYIILYYLFTNAMRCTHMTWTHSTSHVSLRMRQTVVHPIRYINESET